MRNQMPIYKAERDAGLADLVRATASVAYTVNVQAATQQDVENFKHTPLFEIAKAHSHSVATNENQIDLYYLKSVLASLGWNKNQDVFLKEEVWSARATAEDKPVNYEHDCRDIIGHITGNYVINNENKLVPDDSVIDDVPDQFHIVNASVLYTYWPPGQEAQSKKIKDIITEIEKNEEGKRWYVSMECLFAGFDYAVKAPDGQEYILPRSDKSAFLTKHLRAYKGTGTYENHTIGRVLRNIVFSGKGIVRNPANPNSVIFDNATAIYKPVLASLEDFNKFNKISKAVGYSIVSESNSESKETVMAENNTELELLRAENKRLEQTLSVEAKKSAEAEKRLNEMNEQSVKATIKGHEDNVKTLTEKVASLTTQVQTEQNARIAAEAKVKEVETSLARANDEIKDTKLKAAKASRLSAIKELKLDEAAANELYDNTSELSDEKFTKTIASFKKVTPATPVVETQTPPNLDNVEQPVKPALGSNNGVNDNVEQTRAKLSAYIGSNCLGRKSKETN